MSEDKKKDRDQIATDYHNRGYNCCQSVCFAFLDQVDLDEKTLFRVTEGLGLGLGGMEGTCGAISAAAVLAGLKCSTGHTDGPDSKAISYEAAASCIRAFKEKNGSLVCRELRGEDTGTPLRSCPGCIEDGVRIIQEHLFKED